MTADVSISARVVDDMVAHARADMPNECCGLLIGHPGVIEESLRTTNLRQSPTAYMVDPRQHLAANRQARAEGRTIVGVYHSHPASPAVPSPTDVKEAYYPDFVYVIVSLEDAIKPEVRGYVMSGGNFVPVGLVPVPTEPPVNSAKRGGSCEPGC